MNLTVGLKQSKMDTGKECVQKSKKLNSSFSVSSLLSISNSNGIKSSESTKNDDFEKNNVDLKSSRSNSGRDVTTIDLSRRTIEADSEKLQMESKCQRCDPLPFVSSFEDKHNPDAEITSDSNPIPKCMSIKYLCQKDSLERELSLVTMSMENMSSKDLLHKSLLEQKQDISSWYNYPNVLYSRVHPYASTETGLKWEHFFDMQTSKIRTKDSALCNYGWSNRCGLQNVSTLPSSEHLQAERTALLTEAQTPIAGMWIPCLPCSPLQSVDSLSSK